MSAYVIITPAFNEAEYISRTIESVLAQSVLPGLWVIVDDGSTDKTSEIVKRSIERYNWIKYVFRPKVPGQSYYSSNVYAIFEGLRNLQGIDYNFLAILDADISLPPQYYQKILSHFSQDEKLGIASGVYENLINGKLEPVLNDRRSTPKALMVFRKECYKEIGGFLPLKYGGEDTAACVMARMNGWKVWSYPDVKVVHHRPTGMGNTGQILTVRLTQGRAEWAMGSHWLFVLIKCLKRALKERPYFVGAFYRWLGFLQGCLSGEERSVTKDFVQFFRKEQLGRITKLNRC